MRPIVTLIAALLLAAAPASAQIGNPAFMSPGVPEARPGVPAPNTPNTADMAFAKLAAAGGRAEVDLGMLAVRMAAGQAVKDFAQRMVDDHSKANVRLAGVAEQAGIGLPEEPDAEHKAIRVRLEQVQGHDFDIGYMAAQVQDHIKTAQLLAWEINAGQDADLIRFAAETLPAVLEHLRMAQDLLVRLRSEALAR